jgi:hypothetical protein
VRVVATVLLSAALIAAPVSQAQVMPVTPQMFIPSPVGVLLTVGMWIYDSATRQQVYYIEVAGNGRTTDEARNNGFRLAVESALGTLISSETEVQNGRIQRDEIISYAAGFVDKFEIVNTRSGPEGFVVTMKVWVKRSALADRLLNRSEKSGEVDGARASIQLQTLNQERATGDALLQQVLNDFPKRAFDIEMKPADILRQNRTAYMELSFGLSWNKDYLRSLWTALQATSQRTSRPAASITVNGGGWFGGFGGTANFDDGHKFVMLAQRMYADAPAILVTVRGPARQVLYSACYRYQELDNMPQYVVTTQRLVAFGNNHARIDGSYTLRGRLQIPINNAVLQQANSIDMDVVLGNQCPNR